jgi:hypothetical protein
MVEVIPKWLSITALGIPVVPEVKLKVKKS